MLGLGTSRESSREILETYLESPSTPFVRFGNLSNFERSSVEEAIVVDSEWLHGRECIPALSSYTNRVMAISYFGIGSLLKAPWLLLLPLTEVSHSA